MLQQLAQPVSNLKRTPRMAMPVIVSTTLPNKASYMCNHVIIHVYIHLIPVVQYMINICVVSAIVR